METKTIEYLVCEHDEASDQYFVRAEFKDIALAEKRMHDLFAENPKLNWCLVKKTITYEI